MNDNDVSSLYQTDLIAWAEEQAAVLREAPSQVAQLGLDLPNLITNVETLARQELISF
jgi:NADH:ubiquinone oxidoreductase subunit F (NADH-binding)